MPGLFLFQSTIDQIDQALAAAQPQPDTWSPDPTTDPDSAWASPPPANPYDAYSPPPDWSSFSMPAQPDTSAGSIWTPDSSTPDTSWAIPDYGAQWNPDNQLPDDSWGIPPTNHDEGPQPWSAINDITSPDGDLSYGPPGPYDRTYVPWNPWDVNNATSPDQIRDLRVQLATLEGQALPPGPEQNFAFYRAQHPEIDRTPVESFNQPSITGAYDRSDDPYAGTYWTPEQAAQAEQVRAKYGDPGLAQAALTVAQVPGLSVLPITGTIDDLAHGRLPKSYMDALSSGQDVRDAANDVNPLFGAAYQTATDPTTYLFGPKAVLPTLGGNVGQAAYAHSDLPGADNPLAGLAAGALAGLATHGAATVLDPFDPYAAPGQGYNAPIAQTARKLADTYTSLLGPEGALTSGRFNLTPGLSTRTIEPGDPLYHGSPTPLEGALRATPGDDIGSYGEGFYAHDSPIVANMYARAHEGGGLGTPGGDYSPGANVTQLTPTTAGGYLVLDAPLTVAERGRINAALGQALPTEVVTGRDAVAAINASVGQSGVTEALSSAGFRGVTTGLDGGESVTFEPRTLEPLTNFRARQTAILPDLSTPRAATTVPKGVTPGPDLAEVSINRQLLDAARAEENIRRVGTADREIAEGRSRQASGIRARLAEGRAQGLSGSELVDYARQGAASGPLRKTVAPPMDLPPETRAAIFDDLGSRVAKGEMSPFEYLRATTATSKLLNGEGLQPAEIRAIRQIFGDEIGDVAADRPKESAAVLDKRERAQTARYNDQAQARQQRELNQEIARTNRASANQGQGTGQELADVRGMRQKWSAIARQNVIPQSVIDDLHNPLRTTEEEMNIGTRALMQRAERLQREAGDMDAAQKAGEIAAARDARAKFERGDLAEQRANQRREAVLNRAAGRAEASDLHESVREAVQKREVADRNYFREKWGQIAKQNQIDQQVIDDLNNPLRTTPEERAIGQRALTQRAERLQREAGTLDQMLRRQREAQTESGLGTQARKLVDAWVGTKPGLLESTAAHDAVTQVIENWQKRADVITNALTPDAQNALARIAGATQDTAGTVARIVSGDVADSYLSAVIHQQSYLEKALVQAGMDADVARKVSNTLGMALLKRKYPDALGGIPEDITKALEKTKASAGGGFAHSAAMISQTVKNSMFGIGDLAVFGVQGLKAAGTSSAQITAGLVNELLNTMNLGLDTTGGLPRRLAYQLDGVIQGSSGQGVTELGQGERSAASILRLFGKPGAAIEHYGYVKPVEALTNFQFGTVLGNLRNLIHEGNLVMAHMAGEDVTNPVVRNRIASFANYTTGAAEGAANTGRREIEQALLLSPSMKRAQVGLYKAVAAGLTSGNRAQTIAAASTLFSAGIYTLAVGKLLNDRFGMGPFTFDPSDPGFGRITLPVGPEGKNGKPRGVSVDLFPQEQVLKYFAQAGRALAEEDPGAVAAALEKLGISSASPLGQTELKAGGYGFDSDQNRYQLGGYKGGLLSLLPIPPVLSDIIAGRFDRYSGPAGALGFNTSLEPDYVARDRVAGQLFQGRPYADLNAQEKRTVDAATGGKSQITGDTPTGAAIITSQKQRADIEQNYQDKLAAAASRFETNHDGVAFRDALNAIGQERRTRLDQQQADSASPIPTPKNAADAAVSQWYALNDQARDPLTGKSDPNRLAQLQSDLLSSLPKDQREYVLSEVERSASKGEIWSNLEGKQDAPTAVKQYYADLQTLQPYWDAPNKEKFLEANRALVPLLAKYGYAEATRNALAAYDTNTLSQQADDAKLKDKGYTYAGTWREQMYDRIDALHNQLDGIYANAGSADAPPKDANAALVAKYFDFRDQLAAAHPETTKLNDDDRTALDRFLAENPAVQTALDGMDKRAVSPTVQAYRDDQKTIDDSYYWAVGDRIAQKFAQTYGLPDNISTSGELTAYLEDEIHSRLIQRGMNERDASNLARNITTDVLDKQVTQPTSDIRAYIRAQNPDVTDALIRWGYWAPGKKDTAALIAGLPLKAR